LFSYPIAECFMEELWLSTNIGFWVAPACEFRDFAWEP
jgi:hypothetical protein